MNLTNVTITGIDNNSEISRIIDLSLEYPFVEWGILLSPSRMGSNRYPYLSQIERIINSLLDNCIRPNISFHFCGEFSRNILSYKLFYDNGDERNRVIENLLSYANRIQINCNISQMVNKDPSFIVRWELIHTWMYSLNIRPILTENNSNHQLWFNALKHFRIRADVLFDASGGRGNVPHCYLNPIAGLLCGYAGGINNLNINNVLKLISSTVNDGICWIDMESGVRTNNKLDFDKVKTVLDACKKYSI